MSHDSAIFRKFSATYSYKEDEGIKTDSVEGIESTSITGAITKIFSEIPDRYKVIQVNIKEVEPSSAQPWELQTK